ncbi:AfsR/SARP family transcriptional regulator [Herbidospora mongoliensis]|uniref:AfsR/SARP family transcriptional regulator n=1 Tax=Herbidospora mongoliensis TaxID=688067 RepID=UPI00082FB444|nr:BTAD domain-containing putative transcriptional regulator [Herbidospora mongoliensis]
MWLGVLGPLTLMAGGQTIPLRSAKQRLLLAGLTSRANTIVPMDRLYDLLWDDPPASAKENLRLYVYHLRRALGDMECIVRHPSGYALNVRTGELDAHQFEARAAEGARALADGDPAHAGEVLTAALDLWRGSAYGDLADAPLLRQAAMRLDEARLRAEELRVEAGLALGRHADLVGELTAQVARHPTRERLRGLLMLALYRASRRADALEVYRAGRRAMIEDLGLEPGRELVELHAAILRSDPSLEPAQPGQARGLTAPVSRLVPVPAQLPPDVAGFVGRDSEVAELDRMLADRHGRAVPAFVGVTGMGGVGKTGLAVHWAHRVAHRFPDGQLYADLRGYAEHIEPLPVESVVDRFLRALGVPGARIPADADERAGLLRSALSGRRVLMVLDNARNAAQVRALLPGSPSCAAIITSRDGLDGLVSQEGAQVVRLDTLAADDAVAVLADVAGAAWLRDDPAAARLAGLCDGLPLALRIAGARLANRPHLTTALLAERFADERRRLDELAHGDTQLRSHFALSYRGLRPAEARLFRLLGLLDTASFGSWLCAALLGTGAETAQDLIEQLVAAQLLEVDSGGPALPPRYHFHDLVRLYARECALAEEPAAERGAALTRAYGGLLALAGEAHIRVYGGDHVILHDDAPRWHPDPQLTDRILADPLEWLEAERATLVRAVAHTAELGDDRLSWDLAMTGVTLFEAHTHLSDWETTHETALAAVRRSGNVRGEAAMVYGLGSLALTRQRYPEARELLVEACDLFASVGEDHGHALALRNLALLDRSTGRLDDAAHAYERALPILRTAGDRAAEANVLTGMAQISLDRGHFDTSEDLLQTALAIFHGIGNARGEAQTRFRLGEAYLRQGRPGEAADVFEAALPLVRQLRDLLGETYLLRGLGQAQAELGQTAEAEHSLRSALKIADALDESFAQAGVLLALGVLHKGRPEAAEQVSRALTLFTAMGNGPWRARALRALATIAEDGGDNSRARELWREAHTLLVSLGSPEAAEVAERLG